MASTKRTKRATRKSAANDKPRERARYWAAQCEGYARRVRRMEATLAFVLGAVAALRDRGYAVQLADAAELAARKAWPLLESEEGHTPG